MAVSYMMIFLFIRSIVRNFSFSNLHVFSDRASSVDPLLKIGLVRIQDSFIESLSLLDPVNFSHIVLFVLHWSCLNSHKFVSSF